MQLAMRHEGCAVHICFNGPYAGVPPDVLLSHDRNHVRPKHNIILQMLVTLYASALEGVQACQAAPLSPIASPRALEVPNY